ncbi:hypothetical protein NX059_012464 [Plenodomus lindquistii]|nr:hypothetical protein NX059_012464 [Plenodomus lindquistii]
MYHVLKVQGISSGRFALKNLSTRIANPPPYLSTTPYSSQAVQRLKIEKLQPEQVAHTHRGGRRLSDAAVE